MTEAVTIPTTPSCDILFKSIFRVSERKMIPHLSSVWRWSGEEDITMEAAKNGGTRLKQLVLLDLTEADVKNRLKRQSEPNDRGGRADDGIEIFETRIRELTKTVPA